jgi:murein DD-endopeptidase MepM/ murein hydrolase activator NlpD
MSGSSAAPARQPVARYYGNSAPRERSGSRTGAGYTFAHAGRQIRFGPVAFWIAVGSVVIMAGWSVVAATYFAFRDDVLRGLMARAAEQQYAYEDRIAELRARLDRTTSRQLLDQEQFEQKLDDLLRRQGTLESRASALIGIVDPAATGSIKRGTAEPAANPPGRDRQSFLDSDWIPGRRKGGKDPADITAKLARAENALERVERRQTQALTQIEERLERRARKLRNVFADLGLKPAAATSAAMGGPFVPLRLPGETSSFERELGRLAVARTQAEQLNHALLFLPVRMPITGEVDISSPFGARVDPFLHVAAIHTGIDFRGETGEAVRATAAGTVTVAGWSGGYGKMVEIDHGNGLSTRYGHLSQIGVEVGEKVHIGQTVGRVGSTGRSTGPHVHYETRIEGEAVDPQRFLHAGARLESGG